MTECKTFLIVLISMILITLIITLLSWYIYRKVKKLSIKAENLSKQGDTFLQRGNNLIDRANEIINKTIPVTNAIFKKISSVNRSS